MFEAMMHRIEDGVAAAMVLDSEASSPSDLADLAGDFIEFLDAEASRLKAEADEIGQRKKRVADVIASVRAHAMSTMEMVDENMVEGSRWKLARVASPDSVVVLVQASDLPECYRHTVITPDKNAIGKALKDHALDIDGKARLDRSYHVRVLRLGKP